MYKVDRNSRTRQDNKSPEVTTTKINSRHPLSQLISEMSKDQLNTFSELAQKCSILENSLTIIEEHVSQMTEKVQSFNHGKQSDMLGSLKMKQYEFIIGELKNTVSKQNKKEERLLQDLQSQKRKVEKYRQEAFKHQAKNASFSEKIANLQTKIIEKNKEIASLTLALRVTKSQNEKETQNRRSGSYLLSNGQGVHATQEYVELQQKLQQLQRQFNSEMQKMRNKNNNLSVQLKKKQQQCEQQKLSNKLCKKQLQELRIGKYQLDIKLKQQINLYNELQDTNNKLIEKTNSNEILLHKQIQEYKTKENQYKNQYKREKKNFRLVLSAIAELVNGNNKYYLTSHSIKDQVQEIRKLHEKNIKKKVENYMREAEFYQAECLKLKVKMEEKEVKNQQIQSKEANSRLVKYQSLRQKQLQNEHGERNSEGSFIASRSIDKSEQDKHRGIEEKYIAKLQALRKDIKLKQTKINQLQKMQQTEFDHSKQKILELQLSISEKINQIRKYELKAKEKQYEIGELKNNMRELQAKVISLNEKMQNEKQASGKLLQSKTQTYEQKLKTLKASFKQLQRKQQQKTIKYNKLKTKSQKYEVQVSQSLKRKNSQIDQLLKQNNKIKIEFKLLQEKININHIIEQEVANKTSNSLINQNVIQELQVEREQINAELSDKIRQCEELTQLNVKLSNDQIVIKKQVTELKLKIEETIRNQQILHEENRFAKQKIEQFSKVSNSQNDERHSYLKKQLEKQVINIKKMQQNLSKQGEQKQLLKKQLEDSHNQINSIRSSFQKLKDKNTKMSNELLDLKQSHKKSNVDYDRKLSQYATKQQQLISIINYKNRESHNLRSSMVGEEVEEEQKMIMFNQETNTDSKQTKEVEVNTDPIAFVNNQSQVKQVEHQIIPSELIYDEIDEEAIDDIQNRDKQRLMTNHRNEPDKGVNYFSDLIMNTQNMDDHFQICEEGQQINIGQTAVNLQIKEVFNALRRQIEKVFNEQDVSISNLRVLPKQLQDDFNEFLVYVKEKIVEIKSQNNLSFIMVEAGNEPSVQNIQVELQQFITKDTTEYVKLKKIIEEKQSLISSLMNEKTQQQNTINQLTVEKEQVEQQNQNRFMNQCNVYKRQIKEHKKLNDLLQMSCQSLKNIFKNMLQIWVEQGDNEDDLRDNLVLYANISKLTDTEKKRIAVYLQLYKEFKKIR